MIKCESVNFFKYFSLQIQLLWKIIITLPGGFKGVEHLAGMF